MYSRGQYKSAVEYYKQPQLQPVQYNKYTGPQKSQFSHVNQPIKEQYIHNENVMEKPDVSHKKSDVCYKKPVHLKWKTKHYVHTSDPSVWGASFWFTLHNGAAKYPEVASDIQKTRMKGFILGIPIMLPCQACKTHAFEHIQKAYEDGILDDVISGRKKLFNWFVDFHNIVNKRYNKREFSYQEAWNIYNGDADISILTYE